VLQCFAVCCSVFQCNVDFLNEDEAAEGLQCVTVCYSVLQCVAVCCSML